MINKIVFVYYNFIINFSKKHSFFVNGFTKSMTVVTTAPLFNPLIMNDFYL